MSRSCLKFRGGNDDRNEIYSSATEVISNVISFVNPFHGAVAKNARESHTRWHKMCGRLLSKTSERLRPEVQSLILILKYTIFDKRYPFRVSSIEKLYPFHISAS